LSCATTAEVRALQGAPPNASTRKAATWYHGTQLRLTLSFNAAWSGNLRLYVLDWDTSNRRERVTVTVGSSSQVANLTSSFNQGLWITFPVTVNASGQVTITVDRTAGLNAVLSGVFLD
jgi:hypothetical protein